MLKAEIHIKIYKVLFLAFVFFMPVFQKVIPWIIFLIALNWLLESGFKQKTGRLRSDPLLKYNLLFASLYFIYLFGLINTSNFDYGLFDLEVKLSLLIFPLLVSYMPSILLERKFFTKLFISFLSGLFVASLLCIIFSVIRYIESHSGAEFYYARLSIFMHPGYFSMYLNFAIAILFYFIFDKTRKLSPAKKYLLFFLLAWFFVFIILLSSKAGILSLAIVFLIVIGYFYKRNRKLSSALLMFIGFSAAFWISFIFFPQSFGRLQIAGDVVSNRERISVDTKEGTGERILIWKASIEIIKNNFLLGTGTGDVKDELLKKYKEKGISAAQERRLNAHNQYLQTFIALGISGFLVLILMLLLPIVFAIKGGKLLYLLFIIIIGFNFLVESILETQAGVVFYSFFNTYIFVIQKRL